MATVVNRSASTGRKQVTVGVALSAGELCIVPRAGFTAKHGAWRVPLQPLNGDGTGWPALATALRELSVTLGVQGGQLCVALMPPLTEIRRLDLPPMGDVELRTLLSRNAARYFVGARSPQLVGTSPVPAGKSAAGGVIAAAAPLRLVAALNAAARESGWSVEAVTPAEAAWTAAVPALWPGTKRRESHLLVCGEEGTELLQMDQGRLVAVRRFRAGAADAPLIAEAIGPAHAPGKTAPYARVVAVGASGPRKALSQALLAAGLAVAPPPPEWAGRADHPDLLAAEYAGPGAAPLLRTEASLTSRRDDARRFIARTTAAAVALFLLASVFALWGAKRQLRAVQAARAQIRPRLAETLVGRTSVETAFRQLSTLAAAQRSAVQWSAVIAGISDHLDDDAYLTSLRGRDDSVMVEGIAQRASKAFDSLAGTPGLTNVHAAAPVRRESPLGGPALERFTIAAVITPIVAPAKPTPPPTPATAPATPPKVAP